MVSTHLAVKKRHLWEVMEEDGRFYFCVVSVLFYTHKHIYRNI